MTLIMKAGQHLTCANGHHIATAKRDIDSGGVLRSGDFDWAIDAPPTVGDSLKGCPTCAAPHIRRVGAKLRPHTPEGWIE